MATSSIPRVGLIACGKTKLQHPAPARDLYTGSLFRLSMRYLTQTARIFSFGILSAKHGLVMPHQVLAPYQLTLRDMSQSEREQWAARVHLQLTAWQGPGTVYVTLASQMYLAATK